MPPFTAVRTVDVEATFHHSAGRLGTHFLRTIRDERRFMGWRTGNPPRVIVPPKDLGGTGAWVEIGPGARLEAYAPAEWLGDGADAASCVALVRLDGADTAMLARLQPAVASDALPIGTRLMARFAEARHGAVTDFLFEAAR